MSQTKVTLEWHGSEVGRAVDAAAKRALKKAALDVQGRSAEEAPIEIGDLKGNAGIDDSKLSTKKVIRVGYSLPYALRQHEELDYNHPQGGNAKYLENPFRENKKRYESFIAKEVNGVTD